MIEDTIITLIPTTKRTETSAGMGGLVYGRSLYIDEDSVWNIDMGNIRKIQIT